MKKLLFAILLIGCQTTQAENTEKKYSNVPIMGSSPIVDCFVYCAETCTPVEDKVEWPMCEPLSVSLERPGVVNCECADKGFHIYSGDEAGN